MLIPTYFARGILQTSQLLLAGISLEFLNVGSALSVDDNEVSL